MKGCRPLTDAELPALLEVLARGTQPVRNRAIFLLGVRTGFRISELLSLRLGDVYQNGQVVSQVTVARRYMKKKREGRTLWLHDEAKAALEVLVGELVKGGMSNPDTFLFQSRKGVNRPLNRRSAWEMLKNAYRSCGLSGKLATHSMRKTFARRMKAAVNNDLMKLQKLMGHAQITSTMSYVEVDEDDLVAAVLKK